MSAEHGIEAQVTALSTGLASAHDVALAYGGGAQGTRSPDALHAAAARPFASAFGVPMYPEPCDKAAALAASLIQRHPFVDANKRSALLSGCVLYELLTGRPVSMSPEDAVKAAVAVAVGKWDVPRLAEWYRTHAA